MKTLSMYFLAILFISFSFISCEKDTLCTKGEGSITTRTIVIPSFNGIEMAVGADVIITQGATQTVVANGHPNIIDKLEKDVSGGVWEIDFGRGCYNDYELTLNITVPDLNEVLLSGAGEIIIGDFLDQADLDLYISGSGEIVLNSFSGTQNLDVNISGSGEVQANSSFPSLKRIDLKISGSGQFYGFPLETDECYIKVPGSGDIYVHVNDKLDVNISGSGTVYYKGLPAITEQITGAGSVVNSN